MTSRQCELSQVNCDPPSCSAQIINVIASDTHYKYFSVLLVPTTAYFVIANWVGWQYFRNS